MKAQGYVRVRVFFVGSYPQLCRSRATPEAQPCRSIGVLPIVMYRAMSLTHQVISAQSPVLARPHRARGLAA
jgi:hypothetical protein